MLQPYRFSPGTTPLLVSCPHVGTHIPAGIAARMTDDALELADTDWHIERLYGFARGLGASMLVATHSRYVIDLNRPPDGSVLYANANNTELCPTTRFDLKPVYRGGQAPDEAEIKARVERYWRPYHDRLAVELKRLKERFGYALLWDAHSIASDVPRFHQGKLWDLNLGSADGTSAARDLIERAADICRSASPYTAAIDGRFKGGHHPHLWPPGRGRARDPARAVAGDIHGRGAALSLAGRSRRGRHADAEAPDRLDAGLEAGSVTTKR